ncbi:hypothetical protein D1641_08310 [Colidextribacter sp. OB.20]|nr:flagellar M-ring protein FliF C-terminal domain-containing protein [Colidextribacter sp. OB.20]NBI10022.1 hypothetical protein [Colidextribacter sp. OB.20]
MQKVQAKLKDLLEKVKGFFKKLNKKTLVILGVCAVVILALIITAALLLNRKEYALLYTGLNTSETTTVTTYLRDNQIDYQINGDQILVPKGREMQIQADLAQQGYFTTGFNYDFYTQNVTSFSTAAERTEAIRIATIQKLEATIRLMEGVRDVSVDIQPGTQRIYVLQDDVSAGTAYVTITPESNQGISQNVAKAIRNMVIHGEKSLNVGSVTIVDTYGHTYDDDASGVGGMIDANALRLQCEQQMNNQVRAQVLQALESIYGPGHVKVAVNTVVDVSRQVEESTTHQQPEGSTENGGLIGTEKWWWAIGTDGTIQQGGVVGAGPNSDIPNYPDIVPNTDGDTTFSTGEGERGHEIDTTVTQTERLAGRIQDISVAVTIDQKSENAGALTLQQLTSHVATASGIGTAAEGWDSHVSVLIAPFADDVVPSAGPNGFFARMLENVPDWVIFAAIGGLVLFIILLVVIILLRRRSKRKKLAKLQALEEEQRAAEEAAAAAAAAEILAAAPTGGADIMEVNTEKSMELRKNVRQFAQNNPEIAAQMVKAWLKGEEVGG